jgi:hypothetical protein
VCTPLQAGFALRNELLANLNILTSVLFFLDITGNFFTGYQVGNTMDHIETHLKPVAIHYIKTWFLYDVTVSIPWNLVLPWFLKDHWIVTTPEIMSALPLIALARFATLKKRSSYFSLDRLMVKYTKRSILSFAVFILVRIYKKHCSCHQSL